MLKKETIERLKALGIDPDKLTEAIKADAEVDITLPEGSILTEAQLTERDNVKIAEGKTAGKVEGATNEREIAKRRLAKNGIEVKGEKWDEIAEELKSAIGKDKDAAFTSLQEQNKLLLVDKETLSAKVTEAETALQNGMFELGILSQLPANGLGLQPKEIFELAKMRGYTPEKTETGVVWKGKDGKPLTDASTHAPLPTDKALAHIWEAEKFTGAATPPPGGRGGGDGNPGAGVGLGSYSAATKKWQELNPGGNLMSPECNAYVADAAKADANFKWDN